MKSDYLLAKHIKILTAGRNVFCPIKFCFNIVFIQNRIEIGTAKFSCAATGFEKEETVSVYILPQDIELTKLSEEEENVISGEVEDFRYKV